MCAVLKLFDVRTTIVELQRSEVELSAEVAEELMGPGVKEIVVQNVDDQGQVFIVCRDTADPFYIHMRKLPLVRSIV